MKRYLLLLCTVVLSAGCSDREYFYDHVFHLDNQTGDAIEIIPADGEQKIEIGSGDMKEIFTRRFQCSKNAKSVDYFPAENSPISWLSGYQIKVGDAVLPQEVWLKKYWTFEGGSYRSDYTLTVDRDLLDLLLPEPVETSTTG